MCSGSREDESSCGRPLGVRVGPNGTLFVADAYLGVFEVNPTTGECLNVCVRRPELVLHAVMFLRQAKRPSWWPAVRRSPAGSCPSSTTWRWLRTGRRCSSPTPAAGGSAETTCTSSWRPRPTDGNVQIIPLNHHTGLYFYLFITLWALLHVYCCLNKIHKVHLHNEMWKIHNDG